MRGAYTAIAAAIVFIFCVSGVSARKAHAGPLVVVPAHGTADVTDEAGALTLLVRAALSRPDRPLATLSETETAEKWTIGTAQKRLPVINANAAVLMDVARDGTALRAAVVVISAGGKVESLVVRSGDGDVRGLAEGIVRHVASATGALSGAIPYGSLGELRPLVRSTTLLTTSRVVPGPSGSMSALRVPIARPRSS